jgi:hypothetical protein
MIEGFKIALAIIVFTALIVAAGMSITGGVLWLENTF